MTISKMRFNVKLIDLERWRMSVSKKKIMPMLLLFSTIDLACSTLGKSSLKAKTLSTHNNYGYDK